MSQILLVTLSPENTRTTTQHSMFDLELSIPSLHNGDKDKRLPRRLGCSNTVFQQHLSLNL